MNSERFVIDTNIFILRFNDRLADLLPRVVSFSPHPSHFPLHHAQNFQPKNHHLVDDV